MGFMPAIRSRCIKRSIKKKLIMINSTGKLSMVAMRVWVRCMQSSASNAIAAKARSRLLVNCLANRYMNGSIRIPAMQPANRQPKGVMPKSAMHQDMSTLPRGGWVHSYTEVPLSSSKAVRAW